MKLKEDFITHEVGHESLLVPTAKAGWAGLVRGNKTLGTILELLSYDTTLEDIVAVMCRRYEVSTDVARHDVERVIVELDRIGALEL